MIGFAALATHAVLSMGLGWWVVRRGSRQVRVIICVISVAVATALPLAFPAAWSPVRFIAFIAGFALFGKLLDTARDTIESPEMGERLGLYLLWAALIPDTGWYTDSAQKRRHQKAAIGALLRGTGALGAIFALLMLDSVVSLHDNRWVSTFWMVWVFYFSAVAAIELPGVPFQLMGLRIVPILRCPPLARSPRDFWSRRWNRWFKRLAHAHIFTPLGGADRPLIGASAVFLVSATVHEALTWASLGQVDGRMFAFFCIHGVATIATTTLAKSMNRRLLMPRAPAVLLHLAWITLTGPLFFGPINDVFQLTSWSPALRNALGV